MDQARKTAYRLLLYHGLTGIRPVEWIAFRPTKLLWPPNLLAALRQAATAGAIADWLHNLARFSAKDFVGFDEQRFWDWHTRLIARYGKPVAGYRELFEYELTREGGTAPSIAAPSSQVAAAPKTEGIEVDPSRCHGSPVIAGTWVMVRTVLGALAAGDDIQRVADAFGITERDVRRAIAFASDLVSEHPSPGQGT